MTAGAKRPAPCSDGVGGWAYPASSSATRAAATAKNLFDPSWRTVLMLNAFSNPAASSSVTPASTDGEKSVQDVLEGLVLIGLIESLGQIAIEATVFLTYPLQFHLFAHVLCEAGQVSVVMPVGSFAAAGPAHLG